MVNCLHYKCKNCLDTGAVGPPPGDYCTCQVGKELRELAFKLDTGRYPEELDVCCDGCGNIDTEAECHNDCPHRGCTFELGCQHGASTLSAKDIPF